MIPQEPSEAPTQRDPGHEGMIHLGGGTFTMGSDVHYPDEGPARVVRVDGFWIDPAPVTNAEFATFVEDTGYVTVAEVAPDPEQFPGAPAEALVPGSTVFRMTTGPVPLDNWMNWWSWVPGARWNAPNGPGSSLEGLEDHPVVHVAHADAVAYLDWAGKSLPTEAEWEFAARGGLDGAEFAWGDTDVQESSPAANTWQGRFPYENTELDGWAFTSPVGSYPPNRYGLHDMIGNVWEWTDDWYDPRGALPGRQERSCCAEGAVPATGEPRIPDNPVGGSEEASLDPTMADITIPRKVLKGGSFLCSLQYCFRYRPSARQAQMIDTALSNQGFRGVVRNPT